jgi:hypothetical protein
MIAAVLVRVDDRPIAHHSFGKNALAGRLVAMPDHPAALFAAVATDDMDDRWPVVVIGAMPPLFIGAPARPIVRVAMGRTFFPRVLVDLIYLEGLPIHHTGWGTLVQIGLEPWRAKATPASACPGTYLAGPYLS